MASPDDLIRGAAFTDQLQSAMELTGDPLDRIILEIGHDIERLDDLLSPEQGGAYLKQSQKASVMKMRVDACARLYALIQERRDRLEEDNGATLIAQFVLLLQQVIDELKLDKDLRTAVIQNLLTKFDEQEKQKKKTASR